MARAKDEDVDQLFGQRETVRYLLAIILPPVAVLMCGKPFQAILNLILTLFLWIPGVVHALFVVNSHLADVRSENLIRAVKQDTMRFIKE